MTVVVSPTATRVAAELQLSRVHGKDIGITNEALAGVRCQSCVAVAIAVQIALVEGRPRNLHVNNVSRAVTANCTRCRALAIAVQVVVVASGPIELTAATRGEIGAARQRLKTLKAIATVPRVVDVAKEMTLLSARLDRAVRRDVGRPAAASTSARKVARKAKAAVKRKPGGMPRRSSPRLSTQRPSPHTLRRRLVTPDRAAANARRPWPSPVPRVPLPVTQQRPKRAATTSVPHVVVTELPSVSRSVRIQSRTGELERLDVATARSTKSGVAHRARPSAADPARLAANSLAYRGPVQSTQGPTMLLLGCLVAGTVFSALAALTERRPHRQAMPSNRGDGGHRRYR